MVIIVRTQPPQVFPDGDPWQDWDGHSFYFTTWVGQEEWEISLQDFMEDDRLKRELLAVFARRARW